MRTPSFTIPTTGLLNQRKSRELSRAYGVLERLSDPHPAPGIKIDVGSHGTLFGLGPLPFFLGKITGSVMNASGQWAHSWVCVEEKLDGTKADYPDGGTGTTTTWPAYEDNNSHTPIDTHVWMRQGAGEWMEFAEGGGVEDCTAPPFDIPTNICWVPDVGIKVQYQSFDPCTGLLGSPFCVTNPTDCCLECSCPATDFLVTGSGFSGTFTGFNCGIGACGCFGIPLVLPVTLSVPGGHLDGFQFNLYYSPISTGGSLVNRWATVINPIGAIGSPDNPTVDVFCPPPFPGIPPRTQRYGIYGQLTCDLSSGKLNFQIIIYRLPWDGVGYCVVNSNDDPGQTIECSPFSLSALLIEPPGATQCGFCDGTNMLGAGSSVIVGTPGGMGGTGENVGFNNVFAIPSSNMTCLWSLACPDGLGSITVSLDHENVATITYTTPGGDAAIYKTDMFSGCCGTFIADLYSTTSPGNVPSTITVEGTGCPESGSGSGGGGGSISSTALGTAFGTTTATLSSVTVEAGAMLVVLVSGTDTSISTITFAGVGLIKLALPNDTAIDCEVWYLRVVSTITGNIIATGTLAGRLTLLTAREIIGLALDTADVWISDSDSSGTTDPNTGNTPLNAHPSEFAVGGAIIQSIGTGGAWSPTTGYAGFGVGQSVASGAYTLGEVWLITVPLSGQASGLSYMGESPKPAKWGAAIGTFA